MDVIVTLPAYADYVEDIASRDIVSAVRFNTVLPVREPLRDFLRAYAARVAPKKLWIDLKCRQLRIVHSAYVPYSYLEISHKIRVRTPVEATFCAGTFTAIIKTVENGNRLIIEEVSPVPLGSGMSLAISDPSLVIEGYLTDRDKAYVEAARAVGIHDYLLSYVEQEGDVTDLLALDPEARIVAKIESKKGLDFVAGAWPKYRDRVRLMCARGDLYHELDRPHQVLSATKRIVKADAAAVAASRLLSSMKKSRVPDCPDLGDFGYLIEVGYRSFMLGDELCFSRDALVGALSLIQATAADGV